VLRNRSKRNTHHATLVSLNSFETHPNDIDGPWHSGALAFSPDGTLIAMTGEKIRVWNVYTHQLTYVFDEPHLKCQQGSISFSPNGKLLAIGKYFCWGEQHIGYLRVWDLDQQSLIHESILNSSCYLDENRVFALKAGQPCF
jgi:WD40 repeat protein